MLPVFVKSFLGFGKMAVGQPPLAILIIGNINVI
jgi:hypothetical protein